MLPKTSRKIKPAGFHQDLSNIESWIEFTHYVDAIGRTYKVKSIHDRFWSKVSRGSDDECWEWQGAKLPNGGHGQCIAGDVVTVSSRIAWALTNGNLPTDKVICHSCDNPPCCNPAHLFIGTQTMNMNDRHSKGRSPKGSQIGTSRLTEDQVREIRELYSSGKLASPSLSIKFNVAQSTISRVINRVGWDHVA